MAFGTGASGTILRPYSDLIWESLRPFVEVCLEAHKVWVMAFGTEGFADTRWTY